MSVAVSRLGWWLLGKVWVWVVGESRLQGEEGMGPRIREDTRGLVDRGEMGE